MIVRLHTRLGIKRLELDQNSEIGLLRTTISKFLNLEPFNFKIFVDSSLKNELDEDDSYFVCERLNNGDFLYIYEEINNNEIISTKKEKNLNLSKILKEDSIDIELLNQNIIVERSFNKLLHKIGSKCIYCVSIASYDDEYLSKLDPPLKHIPFHCYLKQLKSKRGGKDDLVVLEVQNCKVKNDCTTHPSWPYASCNKCLPGSMTLIHQSFRFVDNIMFQSHDMVNKFIDFWRKTGAQRMGFLYGYFDQLESIPYGIRSNIVAIYEPPQTNSSDFIELLEDENFEKIELLIKNLGLQCIGWIYTQLIPSKNPPEIVEYCRKKDTFFVSAQECITAALFQNRYKNICRFSPTGYFGSKFVTVVITGNSEGQIDYSGWQMSIQAMSLVEADCIVPTIDNPGLAYLRNSTNEQIVPDVYYKDSDEFNNNITKIARPVPVDYFLVQIPIGFPIDQHPFLYCSNFPRLNRHYCSEIPKLKDLNNIIRVYDNELIWKSLKNIDTLLFMMIQTEEIFQDVVINLCKFFKNNDFDGFVDFLSSEKWNQMAATLLMNEISITENGFNERETKQINRKRRHIFSTEELSPKKQSNQQNQNSFEEPIIVDDDWTCQVCTFINNTIERDTEGHIICSMCGIPQNV